VALDPVSGRIAIADHASAMIVLLGPNGTLLRRWSNHGGEPSMLSSPQAITWTRAGYLAILDGGNGKVLYLTQELAPVTETPIDPEFILAIRGAFSALQESDIISTAIPARDHQDNKQFGWQVVRGRNHGRQVDTLVATPARLAGGVDNPGNVAPGGALPLAVPLGDSLLATAGDIPEFRIRVINRGGRAIQQICRTVDAMPVTRPGGAVPQSSHVSPRPDSIARVTRIFTGTDGRIWVQRDHGDRSYLLDQLFGPPGARFDVFEHNGRHIGEVAAPVSVRFVASARNNVFGLEERGTGLVSLKAFQWEVSVR
jgi:hypothetical protein